jgi:hypothetical protein
LLSEDGDDDDDLAHTPNTRRTRGKQSSNARIINVPDDDDDADSVDELLGAWNNKHSSHHSKRRRWARYVPHWKTGLCYFLLFLVAFAFIAFAVIHMWIGRFVSEQMGDGGTLLKERASDALVWRGPDALKILTMDSDATTVQVDMRMGIDVRTVFGWNTTSYMQPSGEDTKILPACLPLSCL